MQTKDAPPLTIEAIKRDPWNAVRLDLPKEMSVDLAALVVNTAFELREVARDEAREAEARGEAGEADRFYILGNEAEERRQDVLLAYDMAKVRDAWQAPAFSRATIEADAWTAVYLPIPEKADLALLTTAHNWARDLARHAEGDGAFSEPLVTLPAAAPEPQAAATARTAVLEQRVKSRLLHQIEINNPGFSRWTGEAESPSPELSNGQGQKH